METGEVRYGAATVRWSIPHNDTEPTGLGESG